MSATPTDTANPPTPPAASSASDRPQDPPSTAGRTALGFGFSLLSALMLFLMWDSQANAWPLVFVGFVPMFIAAYRLLPRRLAALAYGIAAFGYYIALSLQAGGVLPLAAVVIIALVLALIWLGLGTFEKRFTERTDYKWFIVQFPLLWIGFEVFFQSNLLLGSNYWIGYRLASVPAFIQPVSVVSTPALGFVILLINSMIALLILRWMDARWPGLAVVRIPTATIKWSAIVTVNVVVVWIASSLAIYAKVTSQMGPVVKVAAAQSGIDNTTSKGDLGGGGPQGTPEDNARNAKLKVQMTEMTMTAASQGAQLVVWPEEQLNYDVRIPAKGGWIGELAKAANTTIVAGFMPNSPDLTSPNMAGVWYPNGLMDPEVYSKQHQVVAEGEDFVSGETNPIYPTSFGQLGVLICFDHDFPDGSARVSTAAGANILAVPAIDPASISHLRWQSLVFRAVENRVPIIKTDVGFDSAIVDANGVVKARSAVSDDAGATVLLVEDVHIGPRGAPFTDTGGYSFAWLVTFGLFGRYIRQIYLWRRGKKPPAVQL